MKQTQKLWQRAFIRLEIDIAVKHLNEAVRRAERSHLPAKIRQRIVRLANQAARVREDVRTWPVTDQEKAEVRLAARRARLPSPADLKGMAPDFTGGKESGEYVRSLRGESHN